MRSMARLRISSLVAKLTRMRPAPPAPNRSRGHRRAWCGMEECGNRAKVAAYRRRLAAQRPGDQRPGDQRAAGLSAGNASE